MMDDPITDGALDALLDGYRAAEPGEALRRRIIAAAPHERASERLRRWIAGAGLGLGLAAAAAAGVAAGFTLGHPTVLHLMGPSEGDLGEISALEAPGGTASG